MQVAVLGLGEAGSRIAGDLAAAGCTVHGWDPARRLDDIGNAESDVAAVRDADVVLSLNAAAFALDVASHVSAALRADALYADLNTTAPALKRELAQAVPVAFADVALVGIVPADGLRTPALASGRGAHRFAALFRPLGMPVDVVGPDPGDAAGLKLLRSVFMKGLAALILEGVGAARAVGAEDWLRDQMARELGSDGESLVERLIDGTYAHSVRREHEVRDALEALENSGQPADMTRATLAWFERIVHARQGDRPQQG
jgi:3-hydroxyisobutyrate dehydrogenase-like beta-hydroxyacid dehydrogenase